MEEVGLKRALSREEKKQEESRQEMQEQHKNNYKKTKCKWRSDPVLLVQASEESLAVSKLATSQPCGM